MKRTMRHLTKIMLIIRHVLSLIQSLLIQSRIIFVIFVWIVSFNANHFDSCHFILPTSTI